MDKQDDRIIVKRLRPMSEFPKHISHNPPRICYTHGIDNGAHEYAPILVVWNPALKTLQDVEDRTEHFWDHMFYGWIDLPFYEPDD